MKTKATSADNKAALGEAGPRPRQSWALLANQTWDHIEHVIAGRSIDTCATNGRQLREWHRFMIWRAQGCGDTVTPTRNRVENARTNRTAVFIVANIKITESDSGSIASGGDNMPIDPWHSSDDSDLEPLQYAYHVRPAEKRMFRAAFRQELLPLKSEESNLKGWTPRERK